MLKTATYLLLSVTGDSTNLFERTRHVFLSAGNEETGSCYSVIRPASDQFLPLYLLEQSLCLIHDYPRQTDTVCHGGDFDHAVEQSSVCGTSSSRVNGPRCKLVGGGTRGVHDSGELTSIQEMVHGSTYTRSVAQPLVPTECTPLSTHIHHSVPYHHSTKRTHHVSSTVVFYQVCVRMVGTFELVVLWLLRTHILLF